MQEEILKNADRPYEEVRDIHEIINDYKEAGADLASMALVKYN